MPVPGGEIQHVVVTFLIDPDGRIAKRYFGLDHHADDLLRDLVALATRPEVRRQFPAAAPS